MGPDPAVAAVRLAVRVCCADVEPCGTVLVACSGGADSMALAGCTLFESRKAGWATGAVVVDHGLQPGSDAVAALVQRRLVDAGFRGPDVVVVPVAVSSPTGGPEAAARAARYDALQAQASSRGGCVLLGHTLDDQAESVLLGLVRGSGTRSLAGMPARRGVFRRPLLGVTRAQTERVCRVLGLETWADPHNSDPRFARVRVRRTVLPMLEEQLGPGIAAALARTASQARADAEALDLLADRLAADATDEEGTLSCPVLAASPAALRRRVLRRAAAASGCPSGELFAIHVDAIERLATQWHGQSCIHLPGRVSATRRGERLRFTTTPSGEEQTDR